MEQGVTAVIMTMMIVLVFIPALYLGTLNANRQKVSESLYLSTRCIENCIEESDYSLEEIAMGYQYSEDPIMRVRIDEAKVFTEFDDLLFKNINNASQYLKVRSNILCEMIVYPDRYVILDGSKAYYDSYISKNITSENFSFSFDDEYEQYKKGEHDKYVSVPKYFTYKDVDFRGPDKAMPLRKIGETETNYYYINTLNDKIRKIGNNSFWKSIDSEIKNYEGQVHYTIENGEKDVVSAVSYKALTTYDKNQIIIDTLNKEISYYTDGVKMNFVNPAAPFSNNMSQTKQDFNFFTGITFLVIYKDEKMFGLQKSIFNFSNYQVAGYTLEN